MKAYADRAVVIRTWPLGESDRIVNLFTLSHGKLRAVAKGARGARSRISGLVQPTSELDLLLYQGRELDVIQQASLVQANMARGGVDPAQFGSAIEWLEAIDGLTLDRHPDPVVYDLMNRGLRMMFDEPSPTLLGALLIRLLEREGYAPNLSSCGLCGRTNAAYRAFDFSSSAPRCSGCGGEPIPPGVLDLTFEVLNHRVSGVLATHDPQIGREFEGFATRLVKEVVGRGLRSSAVIASLADNHRSSG
ncbi:MAG: DNA repair protein RecO [Ferrimicrobium sp.]|uniref:DNA repair protein RecO n=1 Tax=Ferrimicrobium acidiphilum TaxID=121039 RepID=A0ABV3Y3L8_9ACTN|nr:DNA repair protein RecO [Ferrimicrobium sp.]MCL5973298.1 DNA repair protein RecO [Actinomycetota bacterium]